MFDLNATFKRLSDSWTGQHQKKWEHYRDTRQGTYEFRARTRYAGAASRLFDMGLGREDSVVDVGAGSLQFGRALRERYQWWVGYYAPVDAVIDSVNLETWSPLPADYFVCLEVAEHLHNPFRLIRLMTESARRGVVLTTPNPEVVDVVQCDPTHVSAIRADQLKAFGFSVERVSYFGKPDDTLLAWRRP